MMTVDDASCIEGFNGIYGGPLSGLEVYKGGPLSICAIGILMPQEGESHGPLLHVREPFVGMLQHLETIAS